MRTTVDLDEATLDRAKHLALREGRTLSSVVSDALSAYLGARKQAQKAVPFELLVRGNARARFPSPAEIAATEDSEELAALRIPGMKRRASP
jgi:predicted transcriptional regulator